MSAAIRCPHCKAELPEKGAFCAHCGRRIEGWSLPENAAGDGASALPGGADATRQMQPTPSLLRAAAVSVKGKSTGPAEPKSTGSGAPAPRRSRVPLVLAMLFVAVAGGLGAFFIVRARVKRQPSAVSRQPSAQTAEAPAAVRPTSSAAPTAATPTAAPQTKAAPKMLVRRDKAGKRAHVIASAPVAVKARKSAPGGLPHKQVATDSKALPPAGKPSLAMPTAPHESAGEPAAATPAPSEAADKEEAEAGIDAGSVRLVVQQHLPQVRACYGRAFKDASPGGTVEIGFAIDPTGRAKNVRTETNTTDSESLAHCLETRVREWQFPRPIGGDYELIYPFVFAPGS